MTPVSWFLSSRRANVNAVLSVTVRLSRLRVGLVRAGWVVVIPVRDADAGKTRLAGVLDPRTRAALVRAMALDTITVAASSPAVGRVIVVTPDEVVAREAPKLGAVVVPEPARGDARSGLDAAADAGVAAAHALVPDTPVAVLLGDLPTLRSGDLAAGLDAAADHERALVPDAAGTGTTLLTVRGGTPFESRFGAGSAAAHAALGYVRLDIPADSTLRHDVDLPGDIGSLRTREPGPRTAEVLTRLDMYTARIEPRAHR